MSGGQSAATQSEAVYWLSRSDYRCHDGSIARSNMIPKTETLQIETAGGSLDALLESPREGSPIACAIVCHPHPVHGGTMHNKVVHTLSRTFVAEGFASLRFNFRGVGNSDGTFDDGRGERDDVVEAMDWMRNRYAGLPLWLGGFSFGGAMAIQAAAIESVSGLVSVAPATYRFAGVMQQQPDCPWLIVQGDKDELVDITETIDYLNRLQPGPQLAVFPDGEHFFHGRLIELRDTVADFIRLHSES